MDKIYNHNGMMISAPQSGSGKTLVTCALLRAYVKKGVKVSAFKCGPDYIDPMFHRRCIGVPSENLDGYFTDEDGLLYIYDGIMKHNESELAIVEGAMGLFDGMGGVREEASAYSIARAVGLPIVLVVDAGGIGRSVIPLIAGFLAYDREKLIRGVILNRITESFYNQIKPVIEEELNINVYGYFKKQREAFFDSRHLGLVLPEEISDIEERLDVAADSISETVDMDALLELCKEGGNSRINNPGAVDSLDDSDGEKMAYNALEDKTYNTLEDKSAPVIAVARDEAFCFYYEENLRWIRRAGARTVYFSPISDSRLPEGISGILIGGGYPELYTEELSKNTAMLRDIHDKIKGGMPTVAECGGFMYLHNSIETKEHKVYKMVGVIDADVFYTGHLVRFGYVEVLETDKAQESFKPDSDKSASWLGGKQIRGHEFHYYDSGANGEGCCIKKPVADKSWKGIHVDSSMFAGFPHLYYGSCPEFVYSFVDRCKSYKEKNKL